MFADFRTEAMFSQRLKRTISALVLFFFSFTFYSPAVFAAWTELDEQTTPARNSVSYINPVGETLETLSGHVNALEEALLQSDDTIVSDRLRRIRKLASMLEKQDAMTREELRDEHYRLQQNGASAESLTRHQSF